MTGTLQENLDLRDDLPHRRDWLGRFDGYRRVGSVVRQRDGV
jgi:hypothetical protein